METKADYKVQKAEHPDIRKLHQMALDLLVGVQSLKDHQEYKTLRSTLTSACKELNSLILKEINGTEEEKTENGL